MSKSQGLSVLCACLFIASPISALADAVTEWNATTIVCTQGPPAADANRPGPPGLLDIALVQIAVHDAVQAIERDYEPYQYEKRGLRGAGSPAAAAAAAAYHTLVGLYGAADPCLAGVVDPAVTYPDDPALQAGIEAAAAILPLYRPFFTTPIDPFVGGTKPGDWQLTPGVSQGANTFMAYTPPFAMYSPRQFRPAPPPSIKSWKYVRDYYEVKWIGAVDSPRTPEQTDLARFWSVNFIAQWYATVRAIADSYVPDLGEKARLLALVAIAAADSQISVYDTKYRYNYWRPITAIQQGSNDGNPWTIGDPTWTSFIGNPPYPDYSSGANCLTASMTTILQLFFKTDRLDFTVSSTAADLLVNPRSYDRISTAQREVVEARILQGIHFRTADVEGRKQGARIAHWTYEKLLRPAHRKHRHGYHDDDHRGDYKGGYDHSYDDKDDYDHHH